MLYLNAFLVFIVKLSFFFYLFWAITDFPDKWKAVICCGKPWKVTSCTEKKKEDSISWWILASGASVVEPGGWHFQKLQDWWGPAHSHSPRIWKGLICCKTPKIISFFLKLCELQVKSEVCGYMDGNGGSEKIMKIHRGRWSKLLAGCCEGPSVGCLFTLYYENLPNSEWVFTGVRWRPTTTVFWPSVHIGLL